MSEPIRLSVVDQSPIPSGATAADALHNTIDLARRAEQLGYTRYWLAEHHATRAFAGSAPEILITRVAAETSVMRVGSGGVMLPHYSPFKVAELFSTLEALYPGRIDLGIGRAPGGSPLETLALRRERTKMPFPDDFPEQLVELLTFLENGFDAEHPFSRIDLSPAAAGAPEVWLLGSSMWSSAAAAHVGLPYAFAHFIDPRATREAIESYRLNFASLQKGRAPRVALAVGAICAETEAEARRLSQSIRLFRRLLLEGKRIGPIPTPEEATAALGVEPSPTRSPARGEWPRVVVGTPESVRETLATMARELGVDEVMVVTVVHDHAARLRSYELLAEAFDLTSRALDREPARVGG